MQVLHANSNIDQIINAFWQYILIIYYVCNYFYRLQLLFVQGYNVIRTPDTCFNFLCQESHKCFHKFCRISVRYKSKKKNLSNLNYYNFLLVNFCLIRRQIIMFLICLSVGAFCRSVHPIFCVTYHFGSFGRDRFPLIIWSRVCKPCNVLNVQYVHGIRPQESVSN